MSKSNRGRRTPYVRPVQRVEISDRNVKVRLILIVVLLALASVAIATGMYSLLRTEPTWQRIKVESTNHNCSEEFVLDYDFSADGSAASSKFKALTRLYTVACEDAYRIFSPDVQGNGAANLHDLNAHPNETLTVESALYSALSLLQQHENRSLYLGAVFAEYTRIFRAESDAEAALYDPRQDQEQREYIAKAVSFANDPAMIDIQLFGDNQVKLHVAEEYLAFAEANEIGTLIDFGWMKNAFIADYLAQLLQDNGFTSGYLASFDGFTRNLDTRGNKYSLNVFDRSGNDIYIPAVLSYAAPASIVFLRDYPLSERDGWHYYSFQSGRIASMMIDPLDGMDKAAVDSLVSYAADQSCAQILLKVAPVMISDEFDAARLQSLEASGIHSIWCEDTSLRYTDAQAELSVQPQEDKTYTKVLAG